MVSHRKHDAKQITHHTILEGHQRPVQKNSVDTLLNASFSLALPVGDSLIEGQFDGNWFRQKVIQDGFQQRSAASTSSATVTATTTAIVTATAIATHITHSTTF